MISKKRRERKERIKDSLIGSVLGSLLILIALSIIGPLTKYDIIKFFNGVSKKDLENIRVPSPVIKTGYLSDGIYINNPYPIENQFHRAVRDKNIKKKTEVITDALELQQAAVIIITAVVKCRYSIVESYPNNACAVSKIYIDKIEGTTDTSNSNGLLDYLSSSATDIKMLSPGRHRIRVEGIFYGYDDNPNVDVEMKYTVLNRSDTPVNGINNGNQTAACPINQTQPAATGSKTPAADPASNKNFIAAVVLKAIKKLNK